MKKLLLTLIATGLMATNVMAVDGKISKLKFDGENDAVLFKLLRTDNGLETGWYPILSTSAEMLKSLTASALTAKSINSEIEAYIKTINGVNAWAIIVIK